jgi:N-methylhydantoinase B
MPAASRRSTFVIPDTTLLGVSAPRPVGGYTETILRVIDVIFGAFAKAAPERANGSPFATINALSLLFLYPSTSLS